MNRRSFFQRLLGAIVGVFAAKDVKSSELAEEKGLCTTTNSDLTGHYCSFGYYIGNEPDIYTLNDGTEV